MLDYIDLRLIESFVFGEHGELPFVGRMQNRVFVPLCSNLKCDGTKSGTLDKEVSVATAGGLKETLLATNDA